MRRGDTLGFSCQAIRNVPIGKYGTLWSGVDRMPSDCVPVDLTGWRVIFTAKHELPDWDNQAVWQLDNQALGGVTTTGVLGIIQVVGSSMNTLGFGDGEVRLVYDLKGVDSSGNTWTFDVAGIRVLPSVTRIV